MNEFNFYVFQQIIKKGKVTYEKMHLVKNGLEEQKIIAKLTLQGYKRTKQVDTKYNRVTIMIKKEKDGF